MKNPLGLSFGRLTAIREDIRDHAGRRRWLFQCKCGNIKSYDLYAVTSGNSKSCGCFKRDNNSRIHSTHGMLRNYTVPSEYNSWMAMLRRCKNPNDKKFPIYGGRGVRVCERWIKFEYFLADMGPKMPGQTIERINTDGNYEPNNCRWASQKEQQNNRRNNVILSALGKSLTIPQWADETGLPATTIRKRVSRGWEIERIVSTPKIERLS